MIASIILIFILIVVVGGIALTIAFTKKTKLSVGRKSFYLDKISKSSNLDPSQRIIRYDSLLHSILKDLSYSGSLGEQLKKEPIILENDIQKVWNLHKLRNRLAHDISEIKEASLEKDASDYEKLLKKILA